MTIIKSCADCPHRTVERDKVICTLRRCEMRPETCLSCGYYYPDGMGAKPQFCRSAFKTIEQPCKVRCSNYTPAKAPAALPKKRKAEMKLF